MIELFSHDSFSGDCHRRRVVIVASVLILNCIIVGSTIVKAGVDRELPVDDRTARRVRQRHARATTHIPESQHTPRFVAPRRSCIGAVRFLTPRYKYCVTNGRQVALRGLAQPA